MAGGGLAGFGTTWMTPWLTLVWIGEMRWLPSTVSVPLFAMTTGFDVSPGCTLVAANWFGAPLAGVTVRAPYPMPWPWLAHSTATPACTDSVEGENALPVHVMTQVEVATPELLHAGVAAASALPAQTVTGTTAAPSTAANVRASLGRTRP